MENGVSALTFHDLAAAADTFIDVFGNEPWNYNWIERDNIVRYFTDLYNTPGFSGFVLRKDQDITGFCFGISSDYFVAPYYEIKEIFIKRELQGSGFGGELLTLVEEQLKEQGIFTVTLATERNIAAYEFYLKHGYIISPSFVYMCKTME